MARRVEWANREICGEVEVEAAVMVGRNVKPASSATSFSRRLDTEAVRAKRSGLRNVPAAWRVTSVAVVDLRRLRAV